MKIYRLCNFDAEFRRSMVWGSKPQAPAPIAKQLPCLIEGKNRGVFVALDGGDGKLRTKCRFPTAGGPGDQSAGPALHAAIE